MMQKFGVENVSNHFISFNTICDATQEGSSSSLNIRIPSWTTSNAKASLNGQGIPLTSAGTNELGDNDDEDEDVAALGRKMQDVGMPPNIWEHAQRELRCNIVTLMEEAKLHF